MHYGHNRTHTGLSLAIVGILIATLFFLVDNQVIPFENPIPYNILATGFAGLSVLLALFLIAKELRRDHF